MIFLTISGIILLFGFVLLFGAPYLPTRRTQAQAALDLLDLKKGQTLYELGCGDGRVLKQAAQRGVKSIGYELNPILVVVAKLHTWRYRKLVKIKWANFWQADLSNADAVFVFLLDKFMEKLDQKMRKEAKKPMQLVSYAFEIKSKKPIKAEQGMFLYQYG